MCFYGFCHSGEAAVLLCTGSASLTGREDDFVNMLFSSEASPSGAPSGDFNSAKRGVAGIMVALTAVETESQGELTTHITLRG